VYQVEQKQHPRRLSIVRRCVIGGILTGSQATARAQSLLGVVGLPLVLLRIVVVRMAGGQGLGAVLALETVLPLVLLVSPTGVEPGVALAGGPLLGGYVHAPAAAVAHLTESRIDGRRQTLPNVTWTWTWTTYVRVGGWKCAWMQRRESQLTQFSQPVCQWSAL